MMDQCPICGEKLEDGFFRCSGDLILAKDKSFHWYWPKSTLEREEPDAVILSGPFLVRGHTTWYPAKQCRKCKLIFASY